MITKKMAAVGAAGLFLIFFFYFFSESFSPAPTSIENCENVDRNAYDISPVVFAQLPPVPHCFNSVVDRFHNRTFLYDSFFSREYFLQPEFYPNFLDQGLSSWRSPNETHYGVVGFGVFPAEQTITVKRGHSTHVRFFIHSGFGVRSFQGLRLVPQFKTPVENVSISIDDISKNGFLLGPSFPAFDANWAHASDVEISIGPSVSPQVVEVHFQSAPPSARDELIWQRDNSLYYPATQYVGEQTVARVFIKIVD